MSDRAPIDRLSLGVNTFVWHSPVDDDALAETIQKVAAWGYEAVEIACENIGDWDPDRAREQLTERGLTSVVGAVFGPGRELAAASPEVIGATQDYVRACIDIAVRQGSALIIGPMYTSVGRTWRTSPEERRMIIGQLQESYRPLVDYAGERDVRLAVEPLNRYETSVITTTEQALELIDPFPAGVVGLNLDVYHMNIEEKSLSAAFDLAGERLLHLQVCGNDRGAPGDDHLPWVQIGEDLRRIGYGGMLGFESFTAENASIATAASIWRPLARTQDELAERALTFLRPWRAQVLAQAGHA